MAASSVPAGAQSNVQYTAGAWHYKSIPCVDTTVESVLPRLSTGGAAPTKQDFVSSGVFVSFNTTLGSNPAAKPANAGIVHYQDSPGNSVMMAEKKGDKVQVCFLGPPAPTSSCDPDKDPRGRTYRAYDYRQKQQYNGWNSEHDCGGA